MLFWEIALLKGCLFILYGCMIVWLVVGEINDNLLHIYFLRIPSQIKNFSLWYRKITHFHLNLTGFALVFCSSACAAQGFISGAGLLSATQFRKFLFIGQIQILCAWVPSHELIQQLLFCCCRGNCLLGCTRLKSNGNHLDGRLHVDWSVQHVHTNDKFICIAPDI